ncbi:MAG: DUF1552 domain-containing protein [Mariniblastus sp.]|nr:DUF1552 domain-containing protein [Mariniblastus sp.]MDG2183344.1 DUF1552 domain-containing protein [Mariniblastus sp.]
MNSRPRRISRRTVLRGTGAAIALPLLDIMGAPVSAKPSNPQPGTTKNNNRIAYLYFPNGVAKGSWEPEKIAEDGSIKKLNRWMQPLEKVKEHLIVTSNLWTPRGNGHGAGTATWLTDGGYDGRKIEVNGMSVDQIVANKVGDQTLLPSLELSIKGEGYFTGNLPRNSISWLNRKTPLSRETEPRSVFDRMFRTSDGIGIDQSVVDMVIENAKSLQRSGSRADRRKIDEYLQSIRSIEKRLAFADERVNQALHRGELTDTLTRPEPGIPTNHFEYVRLMIDMLVLAFWADATRVCTFMMDHGQSNRYFDFIPECKGTWHALSHYRDISGRTEDDDGKISWDTMESKRNMYNRVTRWHHEQFAYLVNRLDNLREPTGETLLQNTTLCYGSSLSDGHAHGERDLPLIIAGGGGGVFKGGQHLKCRRPTSMSKLHLTLMETMGVKLSEFGGEQSPLEIG